MDERKQDGLGDEHTIPNSEQGIAVGVGGESHFEPEEDPSAAADTDPDKPHPDQHNAETEEDTVSGGAPEEP